MEQANRLMSMSNIKNHGELQDFGDYYLHPQATKDGGIAMRDDDGVIP